MRKFFQKISLLITYMQRREKAGIVSDDGLCAIMDRLVEHPFPELHKYMWIFDESGVKGPVVVRWLWGGTVELLDDLPPFLFQMDGLIFVEIDSGNKLSNGMETHPAGTVVHGKSIFGLNADELFFLPFV